MTNTKRYAQPAGFSLVELMTVLAIITILVSITIPVVGRVRRSAQEASVKAQIAELEGVITSYHQDFSTYPGPLSRPMLAGGYGVSWGPAQEVTDPATGDVLTLQVTGPENLVLGLLGGLKANTTGNPGFVFDPGLVSGGPRGLNPANPKAYKGYLTNAPLSAGKYTDNSGAAIDTVVPEIVDKFPNAMPILYLRATPGTPAVISISGSDAQGQVLAGNPAPQTQYDLAEVIGYTQYTSGMGTIGEGKSISASAYTSSPPSGVFPHGLRTVNRTKSLDKGDTANYEYPFDAFPYFKNSTIPPTVVAAPNATGTPRNKDRYILISAGVDRVYGTPDDITNFGSVLP